MPNAKPVRWLPEAGSQFSDEVMVADYQARDPFHPQTTQFLRGLAIHGKRILDVGCGCAHLTYMLPRVTGQLVDAIDPSEPMLRMAIEHQPADIAQRINWIHGTVEDNPETLAKKYGLVTAADSIHWTDWERIFPILKRIMLPGSYLVIVERFKGATAWKTAEKQLCSLFYSEQDQGKYDPVDELVSRGYVQLDGSHISPPLAITKSVKDYIRERHSRNGCSRARMGEQNVRSFDIQMTDLLEAFAGSDGLIRYEAYTKLRWVTVL